MAQAFEVKPYWAQALADAEKSGQPVALHFHADWCPTCKAQAQAFRELQADPQLKDITLLVAHYDDERELKRALNVRAQSMVIVFKGAKETARSGGETKPAKLKAVLQSAL
jgi:thiol-disulfide isomerase/thioredoxin